MTKPLTAKQLSFCEEYLVDLNAGAAWVRAGYSARGARQSAHRLLQLPEIQERIQVLLAERSRRTEITADMVLREYAKLAFLDPRKFFDDQGNLIDIHLLPPEVAAALAAMDVSMERVGEDSEGKPIYSAVRKIRFVDKKGALDSVARCLGMFKDKLELSVDESLAEQVRRATERIK